MGLEHITRGEPYVYIIDLPRWETSDEYLFQVGACWIVLAHDIKQGLEMIRRHRKRNEELDSPAVSEATYVILSLQRTMQG